MPASRARSVVCAVLTSICVIQTSLIVIFAVRHAQWQQSIQLRHQEMTHRALRLRLANCSGNTWRGEVPESGHASSPKDRASRQTSDAILDNLVAEQERMLEQHCTNETKLCLPGPKGDTGVLGQIGQSGQTGTHGVPGQKGMAGEAGRLGVKGRLGAQGLTGPQGDRGAQGQAGVKGDTGAPGAQGELGIKGVTGPTGIKGVIGTKGDVGATGVRGDPGVKGAKGSKGEPGSNGATGLQGAVGPKGSSNTAGKNCSCVAAPALHGSNQQQVDALPGTTLTLHCPVTASPIPDVTWTRDHGPLPTGAKIIGTDLTIPDVKGADMGKYTCTAKNVMGSVSVSIDVKVSDLNCDFDHNLCSWTQGQNDQQDWLRINGRTPTFATGPTNDHTHGNANGYYVYLESTNGHPGDRADLESPKLSLQGTVCLHFWYSMYGSDVHNLSLIAKAPSSAETVLWSKAGDQGQGWSEAKVTLTPGELGSDSVLVYRASRQPGLSINNDNGDIAVDDIKLTDGICLQSPDEASCSFDTDTCKWTVSGDWQWLPHAGPSGKTTTGPTADRKGDLTQKYLYANAATAPQAGSNATVTSPVFDPSSSVCVDFYYHMFGIGEGSLSLIVKSQDGSQYELWRRSGDQGQQWHHAGVTLPQDALPYSLVFTATRGPLSYSDVALDDVNVTQGACPKEGLGCDFEQLILCTWNQVRTPLDQFDWNIQTASAGGLIGGPTADETLQTSRGHYIQVPNKGHNPGEKAALVSRTLPRNSMYCLSLWSYVPAVDSGYINIESQMYSSRHEQLFSIHYKAPANGQPVDWTHTSLTIPVLQGELSLIIEAVTGNSTAPPIAVDDISLTHGQCQ